MRFIADTLATCMEAVMRTLIWAMVFIFGIPFWFMGYDLRLEGEVKFHRRGQRSDHK